MARTIALLLLALSGTAKVPFTNRCDRMVKAIQCAIRGDGPRNLHSLDVPARGDATMVLGNVPPITNAPWVEDQGNPCD